MPDEIQMPSDRRTEALAQAFRRYARNSGLAQESLPVPYEPYITYRGRILWHNHSDAMDAAHTAAHRRKMRHYVISRRVPGHGHLLWQIKPEPLREVDA